MDWLFKHVVNLYNLVKWLGGEMFRVARDYFSAIWGIVAAVIGFLIIVWNLVVRFVNLVIETLSGIQIPNVDLSVSNTVRDVLALTNTLFPLDEFCNYFGAYCVIRLALIIYRFVKQWIPTIHGWGFGG